METYNISQLDALKSIEANEHNEITTIYYLLLKKNLMAGVDYSINLSNQNKSCADLSSDTF